MGRTSLYVSMEAPRKSSFEHSKEPTLGLHAAVDNHHPRLSRHIRRVLAIPHAHQVRPEAFIAWNLVKIANVLAEVMREYGSSLIGGEGGRGARLQVGRCGVEVDLQRLLRNRCQGHRQGR